MFGAATVSSSSEFCAAHPPTSTTSPRQLRNSRDTAARRISVVAWAGIAFGCIAQMGATGPVAATPRVGSPLPNVFIVGDSLTVGSRGLLTSQLSGRVRTLRIDAKVGRHTSEGIAHLRTSAARRSNVWVVGLGTNDVPSARQTRANVTKVLRLAGPNRKVLWVNVVRPGPYHRVNRALRLLDARHSTLTVVDWAGIVGSRRGLLVGDRVHLTTLGNRLRTVATCRAIADVVNPEPVLRS